MLLLLLSPTTTLTYYPYYYDYSNTLPLLLPLLLKYFEKELLALKFDRIMALLRELPKHVDAHKLMEVSYNLLLLLLTLLTDVCTCTVLAVVAGGLGDTAQVRRGQQAGAGGKLATLLYHAPCLPYSPSYLCTVCGAASPESSSSGG